MAMARSQSRGGSRAGKKNVDENAFIGIEKGLNYVFETIWREHASTRLRFPMAETVLVRNGRFYRWLFTDKEGAVRKKNKDKYHPYIVMEHFFKHTITNEKNNMRWSAVVRCGDGSQPNRTKPMVLSASQLRSDMRSYHTSGLPQDYCVVQLYVHSKGGLGNAYINEYEVIDSHTTRTSTHKIYDTTPLDEMLKGKPVEPGSDLHFALKEENSVLDPGMREAMAPQFSRIASSNFRLNAELDAWTNQLVKYIEQQRRVKITKLSAEYIVDGDDRPYFTHCPTIFVMPREVKRDDDSEMGEAEKNSRPVSNCAGDFCGYEVPPLGDWDGMNEHERDMDAVKKRIRQKQMKSLGLSEEDMADDVFEEKETFSHEVALKSIAAARKERIIPKFLRQPLLKFLKTDFLDLPMTNADPPSNIRTSMYYNPVLVCSSCAQIYGLIDRHRARRDRKRSEKADEEKAKATAALMAEAGGHDRNKIEGTESGASTQRAATTFLEKNKGVSERMRKEQHERRLMWKVDKAFGYDGNQAKTEAKINTMKNVHAAESGRPPMSGRSASSSRSLGEPSFKKTTRQRKQQRKSAKEANKENADGAITDQFLEHIDSRESMLGYILQRRKVRAGSPSLPSLPENKTAKFKIRPQTQHLSESPSRIRGDRTPLRAQTALGISRDESESLGSDHEGSGVPCAEVPTKDTSREPEGPQSSYEEMALGGGLGDSPFFEKEGKSYYRVDSDTVVPYSLLRNENGPPSATFVMIHDIFDTLDRWEPFFRPIVESMDGCRVLLFNIPGQAWTSFRQNEHLDSRAHARVLNQLLEALEATDRLVLDEMFYLIGSGYGGHIGLNFINAYPKYPVGLFVTMNAYTYLDSKLSLTLQCIRNAAALSTSIGPDLFVPMFAHILFSEGHLTNTGNKTAIDMYVSLPNPITPEGRMALCAGVMKAQDLRGSLAKLEIPVLALQSTEDAFVPSHHALPLTETLGDKPLTDCLMEKKGACLVLVDAGHEMLFENQSYLSEVFQKLAAGNYDDFK